MGTPRDNAACESDDGTEAFASLLQILEIMAQLELVIEVHQHDRRALELWAAREHEAIERERRLVRQEARGSWIARLRRRAPVSPNHRN
jgi:dihydroorotase